MQLDNIDFINSVQDTIEEFCMTSYSVEDTLDIYPVFEYSKSMEVVDAINDDVIPPKPIIHFWLNENPVGDKVFNGSGDKEEYHNFQYSVYVLTNETIDDSPEKSRLLNTTAGLLKYKFDNHGGQLPFKNIKINSSSGILSENSNIYACQQRLTFEVSKGI